MTIVAARDLASKAIRVCTIAPGLFDTPMFDKLSPEDQGRTGPFGAAPDAAGSRR